MILSEKIGFKGMVINIYQKLGIKKNTRHTEKERQNMRERYRAVGNNWAYFISSITLEHENNNRRGKKYYAFGHFGVESGILLFFLVSMLSSFFWVKWITPMRKFLEYLPIWTKSLVFLGILYVVLFVNFFQV